MRDVTTESLTKFVNTDDVEHAKVLVIQHQHLIDFGENETVLLPNACLLKLSHNKLISLAVDQLWKRCPSSWWIDLAHNEIESLPSSFPLALGSLNLVGNKFKRDDLALLKQVHILRLKVLIEGEVDIVESLRDQLPNVWVLNNDFVSFSSRSVASKRRKMSTFDTVALGDVNLVAMSVKETSGVSRLANAKATGDFRVMQPNDRALNVMRAVQNIPIYDDFADTFKLDILVEDYLEEATIFNHFARNLQITNDSAVKPLKFMPVIDLYSILAMPHKIRLDFSTVITGTILFPMPVSLLREALILMFSKYIPVSDLNTLADLPLFVRTAVVSMIRRITRREIEECRINRGYLSAKPSRDALCIPEFDLIHRVALPTYLDNDTGFNFLRPIKKFLSSPIVDHIANDGSAMTEFSELEMEILTKLPDTPTANHAREYLEGVGKNTTSYRDWVSIACRHTVLALNKAPSCPSLTRPQTSLQSQSLYYEMLPLLRASNMTLNDLDIDLTGKDGRSMPVTTIVTGMRPKQQFISLDNQASGALGSSVDSNKGTLADGVKAVGGKYLPFGAGLPKASPASLSWNDETIPKNRNYPMPWSQQVANANATNELEEGNDGGDANVFLTTDPAAHTVSSLRVVTSNKRPTSPNVIKRDQLYSTISHTIHQINATPPPFSVPCESFDSTLILTRDDFVPPYTPKSPKVAPHSPLSPQSRQTAVSRGKMFSRDALTSRGSSSLFTSRANSPELTGTIPSGRQLPQQHTEEDDPRETVSLTVSIRMPTPSNAKHGVSNSFFPDDSAAIESDAAAHQTQSSFPRMNSHLALDDTEGFDTARRETEFDGYFPPLEPGEARESYGNYNQKPTKTKPVGRRFRDLEINDDASMNDSVHSAIEMNSPNTFRYPEIDQQNSSHLQLNSESQLQQHSSQDWMDDSAVLVSRQNTQFNAKHHQQHQQEGQSNSISPSKQQHPYQQQQQQQPRSMSSVIGFSADAKWDASFILAPPKAIQQYNTLKMMTGDELNCWENIEYAPVFVISPTQRVRLPDSNDPNYFTGMSANNVGDGGVEVASLAQSNSIVFSELSASHCTLPSSDRLNATLHAQRPTQYPPATKTEDPATALLIEMGTKKNTTNLNLQNAKIPKLKLNVPVAKAKTTRPAASVFDDVSVTSLDSKLLPQTNQHISQLLLSSAKFNNKYLRKEESASTRGGKVEKEEVVFLTGVAEGGDDDNNLSTLDLLEEDQAFHPSVARGFPDPLTDLQNTVSSLDLLKVQSNYGNIFTSNTNTEFGYQTVSGKQLTSNWYPHPPKVVYRMKSNPNSYEKGQQILGFNKDNAVVAVHSGPAIPKAKAKPSSSKAKLLKPLQSTLFQNSVLTKVPYYLRDSGGSGEGKSGLEQPRVKSDRNKHIDAVNHNMRLLSKACKSLSNVVLEPLPYEVSYLSSRSEIEVNTIDFDQQDVENTATDTNDTDNDQATEGQLDGPQVSTIGELRRRPSPINTDSVAMDTYESRLVSPASIVMHTLKRDILLAMSTPPPNYLLSGEPDTLDAMQCDPLPSKPSSPSLLMRATSSNNALRPVSTAGVSEMNAVSAHKSTSHLLPERKSSGFALSGTGLLSTNSSIAQLHPVASPKSSAHKTVLKKGKTLPNLQKARLVVAEKQQSGVNSVEDSDVLAAMDTVHYHTNAAVHHGNKVRAQSEDASVPSVYETSAIYEAYSSHITNWNDGDEHSIDGSSVGSNLSSFRANNRVKGAQSGVISLSVTRSSSSGFDAGPDATPLVFTTSAINQESVQQMQIRSAPSQRTNNLDNSIKGTFSSFDGGVHHRVKQLSGNLATPWVGRNNYKAATHKLKLNSAFKVQLLHKDDNP